MQYIKNFTQTQAVKKNNNPTVEECFTDSYILFPYCQKHNEPQKNIYAANILNIRPYMFLTNFKTKKQSEMLNKILQNFTKVNIKGLIISDLFMLKCCNDMKTDLPIIFSSNIHNEESLRFLNKHFNFDFVVVEEEIYPDNIIKIKNSTKTGIFIKSENIERLNQDTKRHIDGVLSVKNSDYDFIINHFSKTFSTKTSQFSFKKNIILRHEEYKNIELNFIKGKLPKINLKLNSLAQIKELDKFIRKNKINPVYSIDFGEIISNKELASKCAGEILKEVYDFCKKYHIKFEYGTPKILIERDFTRVFEQLKNFCTEHPPDLVIINNIGLFSKFIQTKSLNNIKTELGTGLNLKDIESANLLQTFFKSFSVDLSDFKRLKDLKDVNFENKKIKIMGNEKINSNGLCPLNTSLPTQSRLNCQAMCHSNCSCFIGNPDAKELYNFIPDGFCRAHVYKTKIINKVQKIKKLTEQGYTEFTIDLSNKNEKALAYYLTKVLNQL